MKSLPVVHGWSPETRIDDERTSGALSVLGELAAHTQVLLFTHHARVVELARATLPAEQRVEHVLTRDVDRP